MKNLSIFSSSLLVLALAAPASRAQECNTCQSSSYQSQTYGTTRGTFHATYRANVQWPKQFIPPARRTVYQTYATMANNGWRRQNLLGDYHFDPATNELTDAGKLKVRWILSQAPINRRNIFVQRSSDQSQTALRVSSVHRLAAKMSPAVGPVDVNDTHLVAEGHSAKAVDSVFVGFSENRPAPVLPAASSGGSSGGQ